MGICIGFDHDSSAGKLSKAAMHFKCDRWSSVNQLFNKTSCPWASNCFLLGSMVLFVWFVSGSMFAPATAQAATWGKCKQEALKADHQCMTVSVPLDYSGSVPGTVNLNVAREAPIPKNPKGFVFVQIGGPGGAASDMHEVGPKYPGYVIIKVDERGTGYSDPLKCDPSEKMKTQYDLVNKLLLDQRKGSGWDEFASLVAKCQAQIGVEKSHFYTTEQIVRDNEEVRKAIGAEKIIFSGISYGTFTGQAYAALFPDSLEALILESPAVYPHRTRDMFAQASARAMVRVASANCRRRTCEGITSDPDGDLIAVMTRLIEKPVVIRNANSKGVKKDFEIGAGDLYTNLLEGDLTAPHNLDAMTAALNSARYGDWHPIAELLQISRANQLNTEEIVSIPRFLATRCEESAFPWSRTDPLATRNATIAAAAAALPPNSFGALPNDLAGEKFFSFPRQCAGWIMPEKAPNLPALTKSNVRTLILVGERDMRTPLENVEEIRRGLPNSALVVQRGGDHSVNNAFSKCPGKQVRRWIAGAKSIKRTCQEPWYRYILEAKWAKPVSKAVQLPGTSKDSACAKYAKGAIERATRFPSPISESYSVGGLRGGSVKLFSGSSGENLSIKYRFNNYSIVKGWVIDGDFEEETSFDEDAKAKGRAKIELLHNGKRVGKLRYRNRDNNLVGVLCGKREVFPFSADE